LGAIEWEGYLVHFNEFIQFINARKCQFAKGNVFKIFNEFFGNVRNVRNDKKKGLFLGSFRLRCL